MRVINKSWFVFIAIYLMFYSAPDSAGSHRSGVAVSVTVIANCAVAGNGILKLNFGTFDNPVAKTTAIKHTKNKFNVRCTKGVAAKTNIDDGEHSEHSIGTTRAMSNSEGGYLSYEIYTSAADSVIWGGGQAVPYKAVSSSPHSVIVYVRIPPHQIVEAGTYKDVVTIGVSFYPYTSGIRQLKGIVTIVFVPDI